VWSIDPRLHEPLEAERFRRLTLSSITTAQRTETASDLATEEFIAAHRALERPVETVYANAKRWIVERELDAVLLFNGRMDLTAGLRAACEDLGRPYISVERSWFGHGLKLIPNECCLALGEIGRLSEAFRDRPLLPAQAAYAGRIAADRFRQRNTLEWRLYNPNALNVDWPNPAALGTRVLILPGSRNEFEGHPDYICGWQEGTLAMDAVLIRLKLHPECCVLRCHPNWAQPIGPNTGCRSERHWTDWATRQGMTVIGSADRSSTYALIGEADYVLVNGSSAGLEAGLRGKRVICVGHSGYERAGFCTHVCGISDLEKLDTLAGHDPERSARLALRYVYTQGRRFSQFVPFVRAVTTVRYQYFEGADPQRLIRICTSGRLEADDCHWGEDEESETSVVDRMLAGEWDVLARWHEEIPATPPLSIRRRLGLRWVDHVRGAFKRGDL
jgi:hypothetical protein